MLQQPRVGRLDDDTRAEVGGLLYFEGSKAMLCSARSAASTLIIEAADV
jgi:hypothetical protein